MTECKENRVPQDLQSFLKRLKDECPEQFLEVKEPVSREFEATALVMEAERLPSLPRGDVPEHRRE